MVKKIQLSQLGWIVGIIIVLAISLYFGSISFYLNDLFESISICIFLVFEAISTVIVNCDLLTSDFDDDDHNLYRQISILHLMIQLATISFTAIFYVFASADINCAFIILICIGIALIDILTIIMSINWNEIAQNKTNHKTKVNFDKLIHKLKSKLLTTKVINNENTKDKIKWK